MYTFDGNSKEDSEVNIADGATRIFLNARGTMDDVSSSLRAFLDYVAGKCGDDPFVQELEEAVTEAKKNREWRHEYMTLLIRDQDNIEKGREEERENGINLLISSLRDFGVSSGEILKKVQEKYNLTGEEVEKYFNML